MASDKNQLRELERVWRESGPIGNRRQMLKWSAIAAGALATTRGGIASAGPGTSTSGWARYQQGEIESDVTITVPLDPYGQVVTLDPHRTVNWGPF